VALVAGNKEISTGTGKGGETTLMAGRGGGGNAGTPSKLSLKKKARPVAKQVSKYWY
jgi:hypothetical protein